MICDECKKRVTRLHTGYFGSFCNDCIRGSDDRGRKLHAELLAEEPLAMPAMLALADFERFMLKFSLNYIRTLPEGEYERLYGTNRKLLWPPTMALHLKDLVVDKMPLNYVSSLDAVGMDKVLYGAVYQFKRPVPEAVVIKALEDAGLIKFGGQS